MQLAQCKKTRVRLAAQRSHGRDGGHRVPAVTLVLAVALEIAASVMTGWGTKVHGLTLTDCPLTL